MNVSSENVAENVAGIVERLENEQEHRLTPEEIVARTWGTISGIDQALLREIIADEDYCEY